MMKKIFNYIQGDRKGKEANRIEYEAMKDPFLADALEGYGTTKGNHQKTIEALQKGIRGEYRKRSGYFLISGIAACIAVALGTGIYFVLNKPAESDLLATSVPEEPANHNIVAQRTAPAAKKENQKTLTTTRSLSEKLAEGEESGLPKIKGKVTDSHGNPIPEATVTVSESGKRVTADENGYFELEAGNGTELIIRSPGYNPVTITGTTTQCMTIVMKESSST